MSLALTHDEAQLAWMLGRVCSQAADVHGYQPAEIARALAEALELALVEARGELLIPEDAFLGCVESGALDDLRTVIDDYGRRSAVVAAERLIGGA